MNGTTKATEAAAVSGRPSPPHSTQPSPAQPPQANSRSTSQNLPLPGRSLSPSAHCLPSPVAPPQNAPSLFSVTTVSPPEESPLSPTPQHAHKRAPFPVKAYAVAARQASSASPSSSPSAPPKLVIPPVPANSWYAQPFTETSPPPTSEYHTTHRGRVVFSTKAIPVRQAELDVLPSRSPTTTQFFDLGKDLIYGMAYLHSTALFTEYRWRGRVSHLQAVKEGRAQVPAPVRKAQEAQQLREKERKEKSPSTSASPALPGTTKSSTAKPGSGGEAPRGPEGAPPSAAAPAKNAKPRMGVMSLARAEPTIYQHPFFDMLLGIKVFVNDELVADHYPGVRSLPQCTTTLDANEAVNCWNCVPVVLMGYQNHATLETIDLYRTLSLSFVEHLLHLKFPPVGASGPSPSPTASADGAVVGKPGDKASGRASNSASLGNPQEGSGGNKSRPGSARPSRATTLPSVTPGTRVMELRLRVEVVYGCRAEAFYCTDFIARGACTLFMAETAKPALKSYEEKLRALILARRSSEQIIRAPREASLTSGGAVAPPRTCQCCGNLLVFRCTVCGADFCGSIMCSRRPLPGYPCGCSAHKAMLT